ncbi:YdeI/OmpD-associated family protein [Pontivivens ytuae]|uniref:YdeI/OmpD-associated family protein n=1 Tax=Pontivivens ytuae TaxID=2789856 RepID=A0A7S9LUG6_9RHOB|nr:YdeI/OmpD-associated family protein [Pontivivens ytuae]QPH55562.1 YdeI/OmpD-associated family protein [Pontivivens ytuae]
MPRAADLKEVDIRSRADWRDWLLAHHQQTESIWLVRWKKHTAHHVEHDEIVEEALCWGWIDSAVRKKDDDRSLLLLSPRKPTSAWSAVNKAHVARAEAAGRMQPPGRALIEAAKANGMWNFLDDVERLEVPEDLAAAFTAHPPAAEEWEAFPRSAKRGILEWIKTAKRAETRAKRIAETATLAAKGERANQFR